jgi:histidinol dehydrogenase
VPIEKVGLYIPGGTAPLLSTVLMLGIPAMLAGCSEILLCTPPDGKGEVHPAILYCADLIGAGSVFRVGGAQAVAAMAYGTESIPAVDKIFGPGNPWVTLAKQLVSLDGPAIDMPAGPSELAIIADDTADPAIIAADLLSQAEHGPDSQVLLVTSSAAAIKAVQQELEQQVSDLPRRDLALESLGNSRLVVLEKRQDILDMINEYAPEHLIIMCRDYGEAGIQIRNAGSVFMGSFTPESAGDYASGTNHTLPTGGYARAYSGLGLADFQKKISFQELSEQGLQDLAPAIIRMAEEEELQGHARAVEKRLSKT